MPRSVLAGLESIMKEPSSSHYGVVSLCASHGLGMPGSGLFSRSAWYWNAVSRKCALREDPRECNRVQTSTACGPGTASRQNSRW